jgi:hypothetical protein
MRRPARFLVIAASLLSTVAVSHAASAIPLATPNAFETIDVIGLGHWQSTLDPLAAASLGERLSDAPFALPTLLRVGVGKSVELRTETDSPPARETAFESATDSLRRLHGFTDVSFGAKWRVRGGDAGWLPGVAWLANVETTTGSPAFRGNDFRPSLRATAEWELPHDLTLGLMPGVYRDRDDNGKHYAAGVLALTLGKAWTPRLHTFVELAGEHVSQPQRSGAQANIDTGVAFLATQSLQVAAVVSRGFMNSSQSERGGLSVSSHF